MKNIDLKEKEEISDEEWSQNVRDFFRKSLDQKTSALSNYCPTSKKDNLEEHLNKIWKSITEPKPMRSMERVHGWALDDKISIRAFNEMTEILTRKHGLHVSSADSMLALLAGYERNNEDKEKYLIYKEKTEKIENDNFRGPVLDGIERWISHMNEECDKTNDHTRKAFLLDGIRHMTNGYFKIKNLGGQDFRLVDKIWTIIFEEEIDVACPEMFVDQKQLRMNKKKFEGLKLLGKKT